MALSEYPRMDIPENEKNLDWGKKVVRFAINYYEQNQALRLRKLNRLVASYNGTVHQSSIQYITNTYGRTNSTKYIDYKIGRTKINTLLGEFLESPLNGTVASVNSKAKSRKLEQYQLHLGMAHTKKEINVLRQQVGVDVFDGMEIPDIESKDPFEKLNVKEKNEFAMQKVVKDQIKKKNIRNDFAENKIDVIVQGECHGKIEVEFGHIRLRTIDPRDAIYVDYDRDMFAEKSPIRGERRPMYVHEVLTKFGQKMTEDQRRQLHEIQGSGSEYLNSIDNSYQRFYNINNNMLQIDTYTVEWPAVTPYRVKTSPNKKSPDAPPYESEISNDFYDKNEKKIKRDIKNGKYTIDTRYRTEWWEITQVGHEIWVCFQKKPYQYVLNDSPSSTMSDYLSFKLPTRDGVRVSQQELTENLEKVFNMVMYQINREITKAKGKIVIYDEAYLPKNSTMKDVLYDMANDSLMIVNSSEDGNKFNKSGDSSFSGIKEIDLGVSNSIAQLIAIKLDIQNTIDAVTGLNKPRQGLTRATSTVTNAQSDLDTSRTITYPIFYFFGKYQELAFTKIIEKAKVVYGFEEDNEQARTIFGDDIYDFMQATRELTDDDYAFYITDGRHEQQLRQRIISLAEAGVNSKELRIQDLINAELEDTLAGSSKVLDEAWERVKQFESQQVDKQVQGGNQQTQALIESKREEREDNQAHDKEMLILKNELEGESAARARKDNMVADYTMHNLENVQPEL